MIAGPSKQPMVDCSLSLHLCKLHWNPLSSENRATRHACSKKDGYHCFYWEVRGSRGKQCPATQAGSRKDWYSEWRKRRGRRTPGPHSDVCPSAWCTLPDIVSEQQVSACRKLNWDYEPIHLQLQHSWCRFLLMQFPVLTDEFRLNLFHFYY